MVRRGVRPLLGAIVLGVVSCAGVVGPLAAPQDAENSDRTGARGANCRGASATAAGLGPAGAGAGGDERASPVRVARRRCAAAGLPTVLSPSEASRLRRVFEHQTAGDFAAASRETERLEDRRLLGQVLAHRWLQPGAQPMPAELQAWLSRYGDHPDAPRIHALLGRLLPRGAALPPAPDRGRKPVARAFAHA